MSNTTDTGKVQSTTNSFVAGGMTDLYSGIDVEIGNTEEGAKAAFKNTFGREPDYVRPA